jgi:predicted MFS family arabinose efflux permease
VTKVARYRLLAVLYGSQFIPLAFFLYGLTAVLRKRGVSLEQIALIQLLALAWVAKFAWAPLVDRYGWRRAGHYRGWLLVLQTLLVIAVLALVPLDAVGDLPLVVVLVGAIAVLSATQDIAVDATAVLLLSPAERGMGNGIQKAGGYFGLLVGGGGVLLVYDRVGWAAAIAVLAALIAMPAPLLLRYREPEAGPAVRRLAVSFRALGSFFRQPGAPRWAFVVLPLYYLGIVTAYPLVGPMLVDAGWPLGRIGAVSLLGGIVAMLAALASGAFLSALGRRRALVGFGVVQVAALAALFPLARGVAGPLSVIVAVGLLNVAYAAAGTAIYTINMDWSRAGSAGTDYTVQDSFVHLWSQAVGAAALGLAGAVGYPAVLGVSVAAGLAGIAGATWLFQERPTPSPTVAGPIPAPLTMETKP